MIKKLPTDGATNDDDMAIWVLGVGVMMGASIAAFQHSPKRLHPICVSPCLDDRSRGYVLPHDRSGKELVKGVGVVSVVVLET